MLKIAAILLFLLVGHFDPTAGGDNATWSEFSCKEEQFRGIGRNSLRQFLIYNQRLYFLFEEYVIRTELPEINFKRITNPRGQDLNPGAGIRLDYLTYRTPEYLNYSSLKSRPEVLTTNEPAGFLLAHVWPEDQLFMMQEYGFGREYKLELYEMQTADNYLFNVVGWREELVKMVKKEKYQHVFTTFDMNKIVNVKYDRNKIHFIFTEALTNANISEGIIEGRTFQPRHVAYYEPRKTNPKSDESFLFYLIEIEQHPVQGSILHAHQIVFMATGRQLVEGEHDELLLPLKEFLDCPMEITTIEQMKGSFSTRNDRKGFRFYLFADDWYYKTSFDLVRMNYLLAEAIRWRENSKKVLFAPGMPRKQRPREEKLTRKYVKELYDEIFVTWNKDQTHQLIWENPGTRDEVLRAQERKDLKLHECEIQILTIQNQTFCFGRQRYWFFTEDGGKSVVPENQIVKYPIFTIFKGSDLEKKYGYEDLQGIIPYHPQDRTSKEIRNEFVIMTYSFLYVFDFQLFTVVRPNENSNDRRIDLSKDFKTNIPKFMFSTLRNCLFRENCGEPPEEPEAVTNKPEPRSVRGGGWWIFLALLVFVIIFVFAVWILTDVPVKTNVPFLENLRTNMRKKIRSANEQVRSKIRLVNEKVRSKIQAMRAKPKPEELKSVKSTSSLGATTKRKSLQSLQSLGKTSGAVKSGSIPKLAGKKSGEKLAGKKSAEKLAGKKSAEKLAGKKSAEKLAGKKSAEKAAKK